MVKDWPWAIAPDRLSNIKPSQASGYLVIWFSRIGYGDDLRLGAKGNPFYHYLVIWFWLASYLVSQQSGLPDNQIAGSGPQGLRHLEAGIHLILLDLVIWFWLPRYLVNW